jgi:hypothetical protein
MSGNPLVPNKTAFTVCLYGGMQVLLQCVIKLLQQMQSVYSCRVRPLPCGERTFGIHWTGKVKGKVDLRGSRGIAPLLVKPRC